MNVISDAPSPDDNGVSGTQVEGTATEIPRDVAPPLTGELLPNTFMGLAIDNPNKFGGPHSARIFNAMLSDIVNERDQAKGLAAELQGKLDQALSDLHDQKIKTVRLEERLSAGFKLGIAQRVASFLSPIVFSVGIDVYKTNQSSSYLIFGLSAFLLMINIIPSRGKH